MLGDSSSFINLQSQEAHCWSLESYCAKHTAKVDSSQVKLYMHLSNALLRQCRAPISVEVIQRQVRSKLLLRRKYVSKIIWIRKGIESQYLQVFPKLYLPLMTEGNKRSIRRWRMYLPTPAWFRHRRLMKQLDSYVIGVLKRRFEARLQGATPAQDLLERRIDGIIVSSRYFPFILIMQQVRAVIALYSRLAVSESSVLAFSWLAYF